MACASFTEAITGCCCGARLVCGSSRVACSQRTPFSCRVLQTGSFHKAALRINRISEWCVLRDMAASVALPGMAASALGEVLGMAEIRLRDEELAANVPDEDLSAQQDGVALLASAAREQVTSGVAEAGGDGYEDLPAGQGEIDVSETAGPQQAATGVVGIEAEGSVGRRRRDPKNQPRAKRPPFARDVTVPVDQLLPGAVFSGKVVAIESFGAFVDIGAFTDGLLHISQIKEGYKTDVRTLFSKGQAVKVRVTAVDTDQGRISLSMKGLSQEDGAEVSKDQLLPGAVFSGKVVAIESFGAFVDIGAFTNGLLHISQMKDEYITDVRDVVSVGQTVKVRVVTVDNDQGRISLSMKGFNEEDGAQAPMEGKEERQQGPISRPSTQSAAGRGDAVQGRPVRSGKIAGRGKQGTSPSKSVGVTKGQEVKGVVKNVIKNGVFLTLESGDDGYLRAADAHNPSNLSMESLYEVGQSLDVRVVRIEGGRISLTMKKEVDLKQMNQSLNNNQSFQASNPFELAFRQANILTPSVNSDD